MRLETLRRAWDEAIFQPQGPEPLGLYRILFGLLVMAKLILLWPDWLTWFGVHGIVTLETMHRMEPGIRIDLFDLLQTDGAVLAFFWLALGAAFLVTIGLFTRIAMFVVFLALVSIDERGLYMTNGSDAFLRVASFFLIFAPVDAAFSVQRLIRVWRGIEPCEHTPQVVWAQRMLQFLTGLVYLSTAWWKSTGVTWLDGTAIYYVRHLDQFRRFPMPAFFDNLWAIKLETWLGLAIEYALATLVWIREFRYWVLAAGVLLHLSLEYSMNVPLFQWIMLSAYVLFVDPEDLVRLWGWVCRWAGNWVGPDARLVFDPGAGVNLGPVRVIRALDIFKKVEFVEDAGIVAAYRSEAKQKGAAWVVGTAGGYLSGHAAFRHLGRVVPALLWFRLTAFGVQAAVPIQTAAKPR